MTDDAPKFREGQQMELGAHRTQIRWLRVWIVLLAVLAALGPVASGYQFFKQREFSRETRAALCRFRGDLQDRVDGSKDFLIAHPRGVPGLATGKQIRDDIANRERTIRSLHGLSCPPPPKVP